MNYKAQHFCINPLPLPSAIAALVQVVEQVVELMLEPAAADPKMRLSRQNRLKNVPELAAVDQVVPAVDRSQELEVDHNREQEVHLDHTLVQILDHHTQILDLQILQLGQLDQTHSQT